MTFGPRFANSWNGFTNRIPVRELRSLRPVPGKKIEANLTVIVKLAGEPIFAKFCQDAEKQILRTPYHQHVPCGSRIQDPGSRTRHPGSGIQDLGSRIRDPGSTILDPGPCIQDPASWIHIAYVGDRGSLECVFRRPGKTLQKWALQPI